MAGNNELIDSVIAEDAGKQVDDLTKKLEQLEAQMVENIKTAIQLNKATSNSLNTTQLQKAAAQEVLNQEKIQQAQNKTAITTANLNKAKQQEIAASQRVEAQKKREQQATEKAAAAQQKALSPYQQMSKELDRQRANAKDLLVLYGEFDPQTKKAVVAVQKLDAQVKKIDDTLGQSQRHVGDYGNAFRTVLSQYLPFGEGTLKVSENIKTLAEDIGISEESLGGLSASFAEFGTGAFIVAIAAAAYYLSQFKSTGDTVSEFLGGLKNQFANFGGNIVDQFTNPKQSLLSKAANLIPIVAVSRLAKGSISSFDEGVDTEQTKIALEDLNQETDINNKIIRSDSQKYRILAENKNTDIKNRLGYLKKSGDLERKAYADEKNVADLTIANAIKIGDQRNKLSDEQISRLLDGDIKLAQELASHGQQFTKEGYDLYVQGLNKRIDAQTSYNQTSSQLQTEYDNVQLQALIAEANAQNELDRARVRGALNTSKLILDDVKSSNTKKLSANSDYIQESIKLIKLQQQNELNQAGLGVGRTGKDSKQEALKRLAINQDTQNEINEVLNQGQKTRQDIIKNGLEAELRLNRARIQGVENADKRIIDSTNATYAERTEANNDYVQESIKLINKEKAAALVAANLPSNPKSDDKAQHDTRLAIEKEFHNQISEVRYNAAKQQQTIDKDYYNSLKKNLEDILKLDKDAADNTIAVLQDQNNTELQNLQTQQQKKTAIVSTAFINGKISQQRYNRELLLIDDQYNVDRLKQEVKTDQAILAVRQSALKNSINDVQKNNPVNIGDVLGNPLLAASNLYNNALQVSDLKKNSGVKEASGKLSTDTVALGQATTKQTLDTGKSARDEAIENADEVGQAIGDVQQLQNDASKLLQANYQNEIDLLQQKSDLIKQNAEAEIAAVNTSIASNRTKQDRINVINAQAAAQQAQIVAKQNKIKEQQAVAEKAFNIANIIENTAVAIMKTAAEGGVLFGLPLVPIIAALGAAELATVIATPLPKYEKGTTSATGGYSLVSEKGYELMETPNNGTFLTPETASIINVPKGSKIYPHEETIRLLATPERIHYVSSSTADNKKMESLLEANLRATKENKPKRQNPPPVYSAAWMEYERRMRR